MLWFKHIKQNTYMAHGTVCTHTNTLRFGVIYQLYIMFKRSFKNKLW